MNKWRVFVSDLILSFFLLRSLWQLVSWWVWRLYHLQHQLIYARLFGFKKMRNVQRLYIKHTKLLVKLPWPSRKKSSIFNSFNSNSLFSTCSILCAKTDQLACVDLDFWKELNKGFLYLPWRVSFSQCWAFCPLPCVGGWNELPSAHYRRVVRSWQKWWHWIGTWKVFTDSPRLGSWDRMHPIFVAIL